MNTPPSTPPRPVRRVQVPGAPVAPGRRAISETNSQLFATPPRPVIMNPGGSPGNGRGGARKSRKGRKSGNSRKSRKN